MPASDTLLHPLDRNNKMKIHVYQKSGNWDQAHFLDSSTTLVLNWYRVSLNYKGDSFAYYFSLDQNITLSHTVAEMGKYDYWLKSTQSDLQVKMSNMKIKNTPKTGRCGIEQNNFEQCLINDSIQDYSKAVRLW